MDIPLSFLMERILQLCDWVVTSVFPNGHWWLHIIGHIVLVAMPLAFLGLLSLWLVGIVRRRLSSRLTPGPRDLVSPFPSSVFAYILGHTRKTQAVLLAAALVTLPILYAVLELPKQIINKALASDAEAISVLRVSLSRYELLILLCGLFLVAVLASGGVKYFINIVKGHLAESMMRRMRFTSFRAWSRGKKPCDHSQIIPVLVQEVEPIAGFAGEAFLTPVFQGGTFLTILVFMILQDPVLGAAALALVPIQIAIIPRLQRRVSALSRERSRELRSLGSAVADADPRRYHEHSRTIIPVTRSFKKVQAIRLEIYRRKFLIKSLNNFINHLTPFFFYTIGGYLVIEERLTLGAMVAVLAAHKDMSAPLRELLSYYQAMDDARARYEEIRRFLSDRTDADQAQVINSREHGEPVPVGNVGAKIAASAVAAAGR